MLEVHESREGSFERLLAQVPVRGPCELAVGQIGDVGHRREAEVAGLGQDRRVHVAHQIRISRSSPTGVPEELREPGPGVGLDQDFRQLHPWQAFGNEVVRRSHDRGAGFALVGHAMSESSLSGCQALQVEFGHESRHLQN